jgi:hypothetical protein
VYHGDCLLCDLTKKFHELRLVTANKDRGGQRTEEDRGERRGRKKERERVSGTRRGEGLVLYLPTQT